MSTEFNQFEQNHANESGHNKCHLKIAAKNEVISLGNCVIIIF